MVTGFIWLFPSAGHSSKFHTVISLLCTLHNQNNCGGPGTRLCARGDGVNGLCVHVDVVWHSWELAWERWGVPQSNSPALLWEWDFCCYTEHQRILVVPGLWTLLWFGLVGLDANQITFVFLHSCGSWEVPAENKNHINWKSLVQQ